MVHFKSLLQALLVVTSVTAVEIDITSKDSICEAAKPVADGIWNYYDGFRYGGTLGMFVNPYYWWHAGEAFGGLIDYYTFCNPDNDTLKENIFKGMIAQTGSQYDYVPANQSLVEGNDDQGIWGLAIMGAVERNFTDDPDHSWLSLTQAVYNTMNSRWDNSTCGGGLRWQIFQWNSGYDYKNTISNGCLFHIAARLARYTGNSTYSDTADKVWDWLEEITFIHYDSTGIVIWDGAKTHTQCSADFTKTKWSYSYGILLSGCAYMYDFTNDTKWLNRTQSIVKACDFFFVNSIMIERSCSPGHCNQDQRTFRCLLSRGLGLTSALIPEVRDTIRNWLEPSAEGAAALCSGGRDGVTCGEDWAAGKYDEIYGLGEQMGALEVMMALLIQQKNKDVPLLTPLTIATGGTSQSNPDAGLNSRISTNLNVRTVETKDRAGAGILTALVLIVVLAGAVWMII